MATIRTEASLEWLDLRDCKNIALDRLPFNAQDATAGS